MKKILLTGGHLTPALSVITKLKENNFQIYFVGRKYAMEGDMNISEEFKEIKKINIPFLEINTGRIQRRLSLESLKSFAKIPLGLIKAFQIVISVKPDCILSFGGYVAFPVAAAGKIMRVPIVTHEQTVAPGLANRFIARIANLVLISHPESSKYFPVGKTRFTGNPIRKEVFQSDLNKLPLDFMKLVNKVPLLYITGGNQGSHAINMVIMQILEDLLKDYLVVHQTGSGKNIADYDKLLKRANELPKTLRDRYLIFPYISSDLIGTILQNSSLIISRAGANTVSEIQTLGKKAIFIPLPNSAYSEQLKNAKKIEDMKMAYVIQESNLTPDLLLQKIRTMIEITQGNISQDLKSQNSFDAADKIIENINELLKV